jgi:hypothetical protein
MTNVTQLNPFKPKAQDEYLLVSCRLPKLLAGPAFMFFNPVTEFTLIVSPTPRPMPETTKLDQIALGIYYDCSLLGKKAVLESLEHEAVIAIVTKCFSQLDVDMLLDDADDESHTMAVGVRGLEELANGVYMLPLHVVYEATTTQYNQLVMEGEQ